jgi:hypothetical protein
VHVQGCVARCQMRKGGGIGAGRLDEQSSTLQGASACCRLLLLLLWSCLMHAQGCGLQRLRNN